MNSDIWTGTWEYALDTARWSLPGRSSFFRGQTMEVVAQGEEKLWIRNNHVYADGSKRSWVYDGAFDGKPYSVIWEDDGSLMTIIAFHMVTNVMGSDAYEKPAEDGKPVRGSEYFLLSESKVEVNGCITVGTDQYPYFEEWNRLS
ncbi:hypothetical protein [Rhodococcoides yunnanense]|uniref:Lipocalin-like domain-containing protein n=1 Tax=Rhodococcoides yunnanense TaxID=278209 RepID=A0ABU4BKZ8_9NOCA|nr:hypothetical protein [Rhodococcus yunnanensis]MDV6264746.1 hypothetical protein [Rhodococcus yunnanensis]